MQDIGKQALAALEIVARRGELKVEYAHEPNFWRGAGAIVTTGLGHTFRVDEPGAAPAQNLITAIFAADKFLTEHPDRVWRQAGGVV